MGTDYHPAASAQTVSSAGPLPAPRRGDIPPTIPDLIGERFQPRRVLKSARGVETLVAVDTATTAEVVLKTTGTSAVTPGARLRLEHEAGVLERINGEGVVAPLAFGEDAGLLFLAMPLLPGQTLAARLRNGSLDTAQTLMLAQSLSQALTAAHGHGVLHRDVKPSNVIVDGDPLTSATLIDFGFARSQHLDTSLRDQPVGTARYASPEQAGLVHHDVDERSDLYSLGVLLFECLAGRPPFTADSVGELLRAHLSETPPDLRSLGLDIPTALSQIVERLLRKEPDDRYQTAAAVVVDLAVLQAGLDAGEADPAITVGSADRRPKLTEPAFVGRTYCLTALAEEAGRAVDGRGRLVLVEAESGGGKTRLLEEFGRRRAQRGDWVLHGQGVDQVAGRPFQVLDGVAAEVREKADFDPEFAAALRARLGDSALAVNDALPVLGPVLEVEDDQTLPEEHGEQRNLQALTELLDSLGDADRPAVVLLDDCQWADDLTVKLMHYWHSRPREQRHVMLVVAFRSEEVDSNDPLRRRSDRRIELLPFDSDNVRALVESMAGPVPADALSLIQRLSVGSPFMASAVLRGLVESGALIHEGDAWAIEPTLLAQAQSSTEAAEFLARRLDLLGEDTIRLLCAGAILGKEFDLQTAASLAELSGAEAYTALVPARRRHILWLQSANAECAFVHDKLREALLDRLTNHQRIRLHRAAAVHIEGSGARRPYDLAYHHHAAGDFAAALPYALQAATEARARHGLAVAEQQYRIAEQGADHEDRATRLSICQGLGDVLMLRGRYDEAAASFASALELAEAPTARAAISLRLGELRFKRGDVVDSIEHLETGLRALRRPAPRSTFGFAIRLLWEVLIQTGHSILPQRWIAWRDPGKAEARIIAARICSRLAYSYWFARGRVPCAWAHLREMNILERYPESLELAQAYSEHAPVATTLPWYSRGIAYVQRSLRIRQDFGDVWGQGQSLSFYGVVLYCDSRFEEAIEKLTQAIRILERTGDLWEVNTARWHLGFAQYRLGRLTEAVETCEHVYRDGLAIGDHHAVGISLSGWARASQGRVPEEIVAAELQRGTDDVHTASEVHLAEGIRLLASGDATAAVDVLSAGQQRVTKAGFRNEYVAPLRPWLTTALRCQAEALGPYAGYERTRLLRTARRQARRAHLLALSYRNNLAHALRERGLIAAMSGRSRRALQLLRKSITVAESYGMRAEVEESLTRLAAVEAAQQPHRRGAGFGPDRADVSSRPLVAAPAPTLSLIDRFDGVLRAGRAIASSLTVDTVYRAAHTAMVQLLRGEECVLISVISEPDGTYRLDRPDESSDTGFSSRLAERALETGHPELLLPDLHDEPARYGANEARSALVAPVYVRGRPVACLYVVHRQVSGLFGADELRLAEFVATITGAALENTEGFAEVEALTHTLEQRVHERTAELSASNSALRTALDELERVNEQLRVVDELKSDFVAMVSHELKSPLTSILGYCTIMLRRWDAVTEEQKKSFIEIINRQGQQLSRLVHDLLEMSRIESGYLETRLHPVALADEIAQTIASYPITVDGLVLDVPDDLTAVADPDHLRRIVINLLDNARKYGAPQFEIGAERVGDMVVISVCDHGPGVPEEFLPRLFEKFAQASSGPTRRASGTGLGLSIVRGLAQAMHGDVEYEPNEPTGARFSVRLPAAN